jgi:hypothetical protein
VTAKKRSIGIGKTWKPMPIPSNRQACQDSRDVYPKTGTRGGTPRGESPALDDGIARTMRPAERERSNNLTDRPDGRSPVRGAGVYGTGEDNEPSAAQLRQSVNRPRRRRGDGSLTPVDSEE